MNMKARIGMKLTNDSTTEVNLRGVDGASKSLNEEKCFWATEEKDGLGAAESSRFAGPDLKRGNSDAGLY